ncbi:single-stranded DNA-binding protein [Treponema ruminis]|uniref:Single-stranded DNA-binding protein n=1 Tax=Treponema ruminis TaxID=744515 RepID=A0A7W8G8T6_9SPIR|nr:single-stranded DNA-binding protein [Treponema ruminis]MBB5225816.1 single-strand DNA-binding protein [Treponema ruminis]QSI02505.1 single-stranded DNA-binding protein [Treponema ruminis]
MNQMNQILIEGRVVRDCHVKATPKGTRVCTVPIATNRSYKDMNGEFQTEVAFFDVEAWGENFSSRIARMATKGRGLRVVGRLKQERWKTPEGKSLSKVFIVAEHIDFQPAKIEENAEDAKNAAELAAKGVMAESQSDSGENEFLDGDGGEAVF